MLTDYQRKVNINYVNFCVGWFLKDPVVWARLREIHTLLKFNKIENKLEFVKDAPIPRYPSGIGLMWVKVFKKLYKKYKPRLSFEESMSVSYLALRECAKLGKHGDFSYVYRSCVNAHEKHLKGLGPLPFIYKQDLYEVNWEALDFKLDVGSVLSDLSGLDKVIFDSYINEDFTFEEIAQKVGLHKSSVCRKFNGILDRFRD
jgi:hypothetical protein